MRVLQRCFRVISVAVVAATVFCVSPFAGLHLAQVAHALTLPAYRYTRSFDTTPGGNADGLGVAADPAGNVYVTGYFADAVNFAGTGGSDIRTTGGAVDNSFITKYNTNGSYAWTKTFDITGGWANGDAIATDANGNIYAAGQFSGTVIFDGPGGTDSQTDAGGTVDAYLTKYNSNGTYAWTKTFDTTNGIAQASGVATDAQGNVYFTGAFANTVIFGGTDTHTDASGSSDTFVTKYNSNGTYAWTKSFDTTNGLSVGQSIAVDTQGNIYAGGAFFNTVIFDGPGGTDSQVDGSAGDGNTYLTKYKPDGSYQWTKSFTTSASGYSYGAQGTTTDPQGNIYVVGAISGTVTFTGTDTQTANSKGESTLTKYNPDGSYGWSKVLDDSGGWSDGHGIATDSLGDIYTTGEFYQTVAFNGTSDPHTAASIGSDTFITKYNPDGSYGWTRTQDTTNGISWGFGVATDPLGDLFSTGGFENTVIFDGPGGTDSQDGGVVDAYITSYTAFTPPAAPRPAATKAVHHTTPLATQPETPAVAQAESVAPIVSTPAPQHTAPAADQPTKRVNLVIPVIGIGVVIAVCIWLIALYRRRHRDAE